MTPRTTATRVAIVAACLSGAPPASAQQPPPQRDLVESMPIRVGPLGLSPTLTVTDIGVDSNIFNAAGSPERDFTMTIVPRLDARIYVGRALLSVGNAGGFVYYQKHPDERSINYTADGRADLDFGRIQAFVGGAFADTRERLNAEVDARASRTMRKGEAGAQFTVAPRIGRFGRRPPIGAAVRSRRRVRRHPVEPDTSTRRSTTSTARSCSS